MRNPLDRLVEFFVPRAEAAAACPPERYPMHCYCDCPSALDYYRWATVQSNCTVKYGPCWASDIRCCV